MAVRLNLGCGPRRTQYPGWVNVDRDPRLGPDVVLDLEGVVDGGLPWPDGSVAEVRTENLLDSMTKAAGYELAREIFRVLEPGGAWHFHQGDAAVNPVECFGHPNWRSPWTRKDFKHLTAGDPDHLRWAREWDLPGFQLRDPRDVSHNARGIMVGVLYKPA